MFDQFTIVKEWTITVATLQRWLRRPWAVLAWFVLSCLIGLGMLALTLALSHHRREFSAHGLAVPSPTDHWAGPAWRIFRGNLLVLGLHAFGCLAGSIAYVAVRDAGDLPWRWLQWLQRSFAGIAIAVVPVAILSSVLVQSIALSEHAATLSWLLDLSDRTVLHTTLGHAIPELTAIFLPLAAWLICVATGKPQRLLAATILSVCLGAPLLFGAAMVEVRHWPSAITTARGHAPRADWVHLGSLSTLARNPDGSVSYTLTTTGATGEPTDIALGARVGGRTWPTAAAAITAAQRLTSAPHAAAAGVSELGGTPPRWQVRTLWASASAKGIQIPLGPGLPINGTPDYRPWRSTSLVGHPLDDWSYINGHGIVAFVSGRTVVPFANLDPTLTSPFPGTPA